MKKSAETIFEPTGELSVVLHKLKPQIMAFRLIKRAEIEKQNEQIESLITVRYKADFVRYLIIAHASCDETIVHLNFIKDTHGRVSEEAASFLAEYDELGSKINRFVQYVEKEWK